MDPGGRAPHFHLIEIWNNMQTPQLHSLSLCLTPPITLVSPDWWRGEAGCDTSWSSAQTKKPAECAFASKRTSFLALLISLAHNVLGLVYVSRSSKFFLFFLSKELNSMKTSTQITSDPCNLVNRCNSGVTMLTEAGKKQSEKG